MERSKKMFNLKNDKKLNNTYLSRGLFNNFNIKWESAQNEFIKKEEKEKKVIDFTSGILVNSLGYKNELLSSRINELLDGGILHSYHYQTSAKEKYLESLYNFTSKLLIQKFT